MVIADLWTVSIVSYVVFYILYKYIRAEMVLPMTERVGMERREKQLK